MSGRADGTRRNCFRRVREGALAYRKRDFAQNSGEEVDMKNTLLIGAMLGIVTATAIYSANGGVNAVKRTKRAILKKIEDVLD